jgi:hypothetical protein
MKNMKMNKWTMGLAAAGVVTLSSVAQAQDAAASAEAVTPEAVAPTLSGYVSTGFKFNKGGAGTGYFRAGENRNSFSLDVVDLKISGAQGDGDMDTGYTVELWMGPAASNIGTNDNGANDTDTVALMQANIDLRISGIDLKIGQFGTVVGNEVYNYNENAFYTHSWGFALEPTHHTGVLASYTVTEGLVVGLGLANTTGPETNGSSNGDNSSKTYLASVSYTLPSSAGPMTGTKLYYGLVSGNATGVGGTNDDYHYASLALPELVDKLTAEVVWDHVEHAGTAKDSNVVGLYLGYSLSDDTTINIRGEMGNMNTAGSTAAGTAKGLGTENGDNLKSVTIGLNHKIWGDNVISRIEYRHDEVDTDGSVDDQQDVVALNIIYKF